MGDSDHCRSVQFQLYLGHYRRCTGITGQTGNRKNAVFQAFSNSGELFQRQCHLGYDEQGQSNVSNKSMDL